MTFTTPAVLHNIHVRLIHTIFFHNNVEALDIVGLWCTVPFPFPTIYRHGEEGHVSSISGEEEDNQSPTQVGVSDAAIEGEIERIPSVISSSSFLLTPPTSPFLIGQGFGFKTYISCLWSLRPQFCFSLELGEAQSSKVQALCP